MLKKSIFLTLKQLLNIGVTHLSMGFTKADMLSHYQSTLELCTFMLWYYKILVSFFIMELKQTSNMLNLVSIGLYSDEHSVWCLLCKVKVCQKEHCIFVFLSGQEKIIFSCLSPSPSSPEGIWYLAIHQLSSHTTNHFINT